MKQWKSSCFESVNYSALRIPHSKLRTPYYLCNMYILLISIIIGLFIAMLFVNLYFRAKVLKVYGVLVRNKVQFGAAHIFNRQKLETEVLTKYPQFKNEIETFIRHMRYSIQMASVLIGLITAFGAVLMYFR